MRAPVAGELYFTHSGPGRLPGRPPMITLDPALSPLSLAVSLCVFLSFFCNKFCEFLQLVCFFCHLQVTLVPSPRAVKPAHFFATRRANKIQGLSNQYQHFKLFSISTGRNKPPGEISQSPRPQPPRPPVTHTVCGPGCRRLVRPHTSGPHSLKNQLHSTRPPRPHSLAGHPRTHSAGGKGARCPPLAVTKTSLLLRPSPLVTLAVHEYLLEKSDEDPCWGPGGDACISHQ